MIAGETWEYDYVDASGVRTTTITDPTSRTRTVTTDLSTGLISSATDGASNTTSYTYDAYGRVTRVTLPEGQYTNLTYDGRGNVTEVRRVAESGSGLSDIVTTATFPASCSNPVTCNQPTTTTNALGDVTSYTYNATHGGVTAVTLPEPTSGADQPETRISYQFLYAYYKNSSGVITQAWSGVHVPYQVSSCSAGEAPACVGSANETRTTIARGSTGVANNLLPTAITVARGSGGLSATRNFTYTANGDVETVDGPLSGTADRTLYLYDDARQLIGAIGPDPDGGGSLEYRAVALTRNVDGRVTVRETGTTDAQTAASFVSTFNALAEVEIDYNSVGRAIEARYRTSGTNRTLMQYSYDDAGRVECVAQRMNTSYIGSPPTPRTGACTLSSGGSVDDRIRRNTYDSAGRLASVTSAYGTTGAITTASYAYWANGTLAIVTDGEERPMVYTYDGFDRLQFVVYPNAAQSGSPLAWTTNWSDYDYYTYDAASRVTGHINRSGQVEWFTYDDLNRLTAWNPPGTIADATFTYDNFGRRLTAVNPWGTLSWTHDALGRTTSATSPRGTIDYEYDLAGRRTRMDYPGATSLYLTYDYDNSGAITHIRENGASSGSGVLATFTYDDLGRRTYLSRGNGVTTDYDFDTTGRLSEMVQTMASSSDDLDVDFTYNPAGQILSRTASNDSYSWDEYVNVDIDYVVNGLNQITSITGSSAPTHDARGNITYDGDQYYCYDSSNRLTGVYTATGCGAGDRLVGLYYDAAGRHWATDSNYSVQFLYDGAQIAAEYNWSGTLHRRYVTVPGSDEIIARYEGSTLSDRRWVIQDERGSVIAETDNSGGVVYRNTYDEYGNPGATNMGRFGYAGYQWLSQANIWHARARGYQPRLGRFLQTDPIGQAGGMNLYAYVGNDPINRIDPWGLMEVCVPYLWEYTGEPVRDEDGNIIGRQPGSKLVAVATNCFGWDSREKMHPGGPGAHGGVDGDELAEDVHAVVNGECSRHTYRSNQELAAADYHSYKAMEATAGAVGYFILGVLLVELPPLAAGAGGLSSAMGFGAAFEGAQADAHTNEAIRHQNAAIDCQARN